MMLVAVPVVRCAGVTTMNRTTAETDSGETTWLLGSGFERSIFTDG
jgi:hypothetical protein